MALSWCKNWWFTKCRNRTGLVYGVHSVLLYGLTGVKIRQQVWWFIISDSSTLAKSEFPFLSLLLDGSVSSSSIQVDDDFAGPSRKFGWDNTKESTEHMGRLPVEKLTVAEQSFYMNHCINFQKAKVLDCKVNLVKEAIEITLHLNYFSRVVTEPGTFAGHTARWW